MSNQIARLVRRPRRPVALDDARPQLQRNHCRLAAGLCVAQDLSICCCPTAAQHPDTTASRQRASILAWLIDGADVLA